MLAKEKGKLTGKEMYKLIWKEKVKDGLERGRL